MGRRGPRPAPDWLKALRGNPHKGKLTLPYPVQTPPEVSSTPDIPAFLTGQRERTLFAEVARGKRAADSFAVARWCSYQAAWEDAVAHDAPVRHLRYLERALNKLEDVLGLTPRARMLAGMADQDP